jgi:hypothetical protein
MVSPMAMIERLGVPATVSKTPSFVLVTAKAGAIVL